MIARRWTPGPIWIEYAFVLAIIAGLVYTAWFLAAYGYLPQPWFYEPSGTFMDWYSLSYYANYRGAYDIGGTIYPPLSFVIMRIFSFKSCYAGAIGEPSRDCDWMGIALLTAGLFIAIVVTFWTFYKYDRATFFPRAFALSFGFPLVYAYERGNMVLFTYICVLLGFGPLLRSARLRWFFAGMSLNFKVYLIAAALAPLLRRRWLQAEGIIISTVLIYVGTWMFLGEGSPTELYNDVFSYGTQFGASRVLDLWYPSSFIPATSLLRGEYFSILALLDSRLVDTLLMVCTFMTRSGQLMILLAAVATWLRPEVVPPHRVLFLAISMALLTAEVGGYTEVIVFFFVFLERWKGIGRPIAICLAYVLCVPADYVFEKAQPLVRWSWLAGSDVIAEYGVGLIALARPVLMVVMIWALASVTLRAVWIDIREQGWRGRWRFRRDIPFFPGVLYPGRQLPAGNGDVPRLPQGAIRPD